MRAAGFPQQMAINRRLQKVQRISCWQSFECPYAGMDPGEGSHHSHRPHSCRNIGLRGHDPDISDSGIRGGARYRHEGQPKPRHKVKEDESERMLVAEIQELDEVKTLVVKGQQ